MSKQKQKTTPDVQRSTPNAQFRRTSELDVRRSMFGVRRFLPNNS
jgi:hypothetical protein